MIKSLSGCPCSTSVIIGLTLGIDTMVEIEGLAVKSEIGLKDCKQLEVLTMSKIEILPKIGVTLIKIIIEVSILNEIANVKVDVDNFEVDKTEVLYGTDKIIEQAEVLTIQDDETGAEGASSVAKEVIVSLTDEVVDTSIVISWSWEVVDLD